MGEQRNLTEDNVEELRIHLERMSKNNPDLQYRFFKQDKVEKIEPTNREIMDKIEALDRKFDLIFGGHALKDCQWFKIPL